MSIYSSIVLLEKRRDEIRQWLNAEAPFTAHDQKHLNAHSPEQAYWHHGYQAACNDLLESLQRDAADHKEQ